MFGRYAIAFSSTCIAMSIGLSSCSLSKRPLVVAAVCLRNEGDIEKFRSELLNISREEILVVVDRSAVTSKEKEQLGYRTHDKRRGEHVGITLQDQNGGRVSISSLGDNYQVAMGFSGKPNDVEALAFSERILERLGHKWTVVVAPDGQGAQPLKDCRPDAEGIG